MFEYVPASEQTSMLEPRIPRVGESPFVRVCISTAACLPWTARRRDSSPIPRASSDWLGCREAAPRKCLSSNCRPSRLYQCIGTLLPQHQPPQTSPRPPPLPCSHAVVNKIFPLTFCSLETGLAALGDRAHWGGACGFVVAAAYQSGKSVEDIQRSANSRYVRKRDAPGRESEIDDSRAFAHPEQAAYQEAQRIRAKKLKKQSSELQVNGRRRKSCSLGGGG